MVTSIRHIHRNIFIFLTQRAAQTFSLETLKDTTDELRTSMYDISKSVMELEAEKKDRLKRKAGEDKRQQGEGLAVEPVKKKWTEGKEPEDSTDNIDANVDYYPGAEDKPMTPKKTGKTASLQSLLAPDTREYRTTAADREERMKQRSDKRETPDSTQKDMEEQEGQEGEEMTEKQWLERAIEDQQKELKKLEWEKQHTIEECSRQKARVSGSHNKRGIEEEEGLHP